MDFKEFKTVLVGPFPPPTHGSSILAKQLSEGLNARKIYSNVSSGRNTVLSIVFLLSSLFKIKEEKIIVFTASKFIGKFRDIIIIVILLMKKKDIYVCIHNNPFFTNGILSKVLLLLSKYFTSIFSYESDEYFLLKSKSRDVFVIHTAVPDEKLISRQKIKRNIENPIRFSVCSHILKSKNVDKAITLLSHSKINWKLDIVGSYNSRYGKSFIQKYKSDDRITFHGEIYGIEKIKILIQSDILIHLSENEEFPLIQIECLGLGLPFLSYKNVGGISKILNYKTSDKLFYDKDYLLSKNLIKIISEIKADINLKNDMRNTFEKYFSIDKMLNKYKNIGL